MKNRTIAIILTLTLLLSITACNKPAESTASVSTTKSNATTVTTAATTETERYPSYLSLDSQIPVIKEGEGKDIILSVAVQRAAGGGDWEKLWLAKYIDQYMNIQMEVEQIESEALGERKTLMFAAKDLPDIMMNLNFSAVEVVNYGMINGQLLTMDQYLDQELTPEINYWFETRPDAKATATTPDGHIYTLPAINEVDDEGSVPRLFIDQTWLEACNLEIPTTLDDFLSMARTFKTQDPAGVGSDKNIPLGGGFDYVNLGYYFLNAMGYVDLHQSSTGLNPAIRNDDCELPCGNPELFYEYLKIMRSCYEEGLFSADYFVLDSTGVNAQLNSGRIGVVGFPVYTAGLDSWEDWMAAKPLTSQWNDTPGWPTPSGATIGGFAMSADTQLAELGLRFANCYFSTNYLSRMLWIAPADGHEEAMGYTGRILNEARNWTNFDISKFPNGITDVYTYLISYIAVQPTFGTVGTRATTNDYVVSLLGGEEPGYKQFDITTPDQHYRAGVWQNMMPYCTVTFPRTYYLDEETTIRMSDLLAVIGPYVNEQVALFISGDRSLDEFNLYLNELKAIGFDEYQQIYKDIWVSYKDALEG